MNSNSIEDQLRSARIAEYPVVAQNFRELAEIRFKLLGLLPIGTVLGTYVSISSQNEVSFFISLFGLIVTLALVVYNERNDQLYDELVSRAAELERLVGLPDGNFSQRPCGWLKIRLVPGTRDSDLVVNVNHRWAVATIYRASVLAWLFAILTPVFTWALSSSAIVFGPLAPVRASVVAAATALVCTIIFSIWFKRQKDNRSKHMRVKAVEAIDQLAQLRFGPPNIADREKWSKIFYAAATLRSGNRKKKLRSRRCEKELNTVFRRGLFYLSPDLTQLSTNQYYPVPPPGSPCLFGVISAAHILALLTDLPVRWLLDTYYDRRGKKEPKITNAEQWINEFKSEGKFASSAQSIESPGADVKPV